MRPPPVERVRAALAREAGAELAARLPRGYQRLGHLVILRNFPDELRPWGSRIGRLFQEALGVETVLAFPGGIQGEFRRPSALCLAGSRTEVTHREEGILWRFDAEEIMFAQGNRHERRRAGTLVQPGERVVDLFAGIGYFSIPAARFGRAAEVIAVEKNPVSLRYLEENARLNGVAGTLRPLGGDNREVPLPRDWADRVFLGYLPDSLPFLPRAVATLRTGGGWVHAHLVVSARRREEEALSRFARAARESHATVASAEVVPVKPYGPGRTHVAVDARIIPRMGSSAER